MKWLVTMTVPCVFLALLCGCGGEEVPAPEDEVVKAPAPDMLPPSDDAPRREGEPWMDWRADDGNGDGAAAGAAKEDGWPGVDDDPSFDSADGSGDWCGTGMRRGPLRGGNVLIQDGKVIRIGVAWGEPDARGLWRRHRYHSFLPDELKAMGTRIDALLEKISSASEDDIASLPAWRAELGRLQERIRSGLEMWVQLGIEIDGVFYTSAFGESEDAFLARARREAAKRK